jgi:hypothetical protein
VVLSVNYPTPVWVNGFQCRNCSDVDLAKKHVDPAHPKSGPFGVDAKSDPSRILQDAVSFGGQLTGMPTGGSSGSAGAPTGLGSQLDITA